MRRVWIAVAMLSITTAGRAQGTVQSTVLSSSVSAPTPDSVTVASSDDVAVTPFKLGESTEYDVKFGIIHVGSATTEVVGVEDVRGRSAWHTVFRVKAGTLFYHVNDMFESWIDRATLSSLRFYQTQEEGSKTRNKRYEMYPEKRVFVETDKNPPHEFPGVADPLDDGSFLFFIRTIPLAVGQTYEFNRYYRPERNPVRIRVLRKERISVPAGTFDCIVVQPIIKTAGIFSENGHAEVWLTDDPRHIVVQLKSHLSFGSIDLYLRSYKAGS
ncbi:MAG TPA: DUF3108 domain-containing protein [Gemmatimonadaceae bacterium]|nr:DUF3108 domain-containing protein [Gemmatimonadaceae bacterium]